SVISARATCTGRSSELPPNAMLKTNDPPEAPDASTPPVIVAVGKLAFGLPPVVDDSTMGLESRPFHCGAIVFSAVTSPSANAATFCFGGPPSSNIGVRAPASMAVFIVFVGDDVKLVMKETMFLPHE